MRTQEARRSSFSPAYNDDAMFGEVAREQRAHVPDRHSLLVSPYTATITLGKVGSERVDWSQWARHCKTILKFAPHQGAQIEARDWRRLGYPIAAAFLDAGKVREVRRGPGFNQPHWRDRMSSELELEKALVQSNI